MDLIHLKYFQNVAKTEHITKSSKELNIVQPALSRSITNLESELGVKLFDRKGRVIKLNDNGKYFLGVVNQTLDTFENGKSKLLEMNDESNNEIKLLVLAGSNTVTDLIVSFRKIYPKTKFKLLQTANNSVNNFDFLISSTLTKDYSENCITLIEEELFIGVSTSNTLSKKNKIHLKELSNEHFIGFEDGKPFRNISDSLCKKAGFKPHIVFESDMVKIVKDMIIAGAGISFIPEITWEISSDKSLKLLKVVEPNCKRYLNLYYNPSSCQSSICQIFSEFTRDYYADMQNKA